MRTVYAVALAAGAAALLGWILVHGMAANTNRPGRDPERRFGLAGRRVVAGVFGFGMAGMSGEFAAREISPPAVFGLAVAGALAAAWWSGQIAEPVAEPVDGSVEDLDGAPE